MSMKKIQASIGLISYVGVNNLFGRVASSLLQQTPGIKKLFLYDDTDIRRKKNKEEPVQNEPIVTEFSGRNNLPEALENADLIVLGDESEADATGTGNNLKNVAKRICDYIETFGRVYTSKKPPIIVVASSPLNIIVPLMAEALEMEKLFIPERLFGSTSGDTFRASVQLASHLRTQPGAVVVPVVGGSSYDTRVPLFSQMHPQIALSEETRDKLIHKTKSLDQEAFNVTEIIERAYTTVRFLSSIVAGLHGKRNTPEISMVETSQHPNVRFLSVPVILGEHGIKRCVNIPTLTPVEEEMLEKAVQAMKDDALTAKNLLKEITAEKDSPKEKTPPTKTEYLVTDINLKDFDNKECLSTDIAPLFVSKKSMFAKKIKLPTPKQTVQKEIGTTRTQSETGIKIERKSQVIYSPKKKNGNNTEEKGTRASETDGEKIPHRKRRRFSGRRGKTRPFTAPINPGVPNQIEDTAKSRESPEPLSLPMKTAGEKYDEKTESSVVKPENRLFGKVQVTLGETETKPSQVKDDTTKIDVHKSPSSAGKGGKSEVTIPMELKKETKEDPKKKNGKLEINLNSKLKEKNPTTTVQPSKSDAKALDEPVKKEKPHKVTSFSYSALVDSLPKIRPTIEPEFPTVESSPSLHQTKAQDEPPQQTKQPPRNEQQPSKKNRQPRSRLSIARSTTRSSEAKKYERFRQFAGIFEKVDTGEAAVSIKQDTKEPSMEVNEADEHRMKSVASVESITIQQVEKTKEEESKFSTERKGAKEDLKTSGSLNHGASDEIRCLDKRIEMSPVPKKEEKKVKSFDSKNVSPQRTETRSRSPSKQYTPTISSPKIRTKTPDSNTKHLPSPLKPKSIHKGPRREFTECQKLSDESNSTKNHQASQPQNTKYKQDAYRHEIKSSAYMKIALRKPSFIPVKTTQQSKTKHPRSKSRLAKLFGVSPKPKYDNVEVVKREIPNTSKNPGRTKSDSSSKPGSKDRPSKSPSSERVTGEFKPSLNTSQLTSDKNKHEAHHTTNFKIQTVNPYSNDGSAKPGASIERNQRLHTVENLLANHKLTLARSNAKSMDDESIQIRPKSSYLDNLKTFESSASQSVETSQSESKWGKIFHVFKQVINNDLKKEEDRKIKRRPVPAGKRRSNKIGGKSPVLVNVSSETFKLSRSGEGVKPCPTKLKTYFNRRGNSASNPPEGY